MAGLAGLGVGEAVGGVTGALIGMGIPEFRSQEIRRSPAEGRNSALCTLRHGRGNQACQGSSQVGGGEDVSSTGESSVDVKKTDRDLAGTAAR